MNNVGSVWEDYGRGDWLYFLLIEKKQRESIKMFLKTTTALSKLDWP